MNKKYKIILKNNQPFLWSALMSVLKDNRSRLMLYISHIPLYGPKNIIITEGQPVIRFNRGQSS